MKNITYHVVHVITAITFIFSRGVTSCFSSSDITFRRVSLKNSVSITTTIDFNRTPEKDAGILELPTPLDTESDNPVVWEFNVTGSSNPGALLQPTPSYAYIFRNRPAFSAGMLL